MVTVFSDLSGQNITISVNPMLLGKEYFIFNVLGKTVLKNTFDREVINLNSAELKSGLYFLKVGNGVGIKFIF